MAYRIGENLTVSQVSRDLVDFLTQLATIYDITYDTKKKNGYLKDLSFVQEKTKTETWTLKYDHEDSNGNKVFKVSGTVSGDQDDLTSTKAYDNGIFSVTLTTNDWTDGDVITWKTKETSDPKWELKRNYKILPKIKTKSGHWLRPSYSNFVSKFITDGKYDSTPGVGDFFRSENPLHYKFDESNNDADDIGSSHFAFSGWFRNFEADRWGNDYNGFYNNHVVTAISTEDHYVAAYMTKTRWMLSKSNSNNPGRSGGGSTWNFYNWHSSRVNTDDGGKEGDDYVKVDNVNYFEKGQIVYTDHTYQKLTIDSVDSSNNTVKFTTKLKRDMQNDEYLNRYFPYEENKWNLLVVNFNAPDNEMTVYLNKVKIFHTTSAYLYDEKYQITRWYGGAKIWSNVAQWGKELTQDEINDIYESNTPVDTSSSDIVDAPLPDWDEAIDGFIVKSTHSDLKFPLFLQMHPYPKNRDVSQPMWAFSTGVRWYRLPNNTGLLKTIDEWNEVNFAPSEFVVQINQQSAVINPERRNGYMDDWKGGGLLTREPTEKITKYWFVSDGKTLIVAFKIYDANSPAKNPTYQLVYVGDLDGNDMTAYNYGSFSTNNGQDYWYNDDSKYSLWTTLYENKRNKKPNYASFYIEPSISASGLYSFAPDFLGGTDVSKGNYTLYPIYAYDRLRYDEYRNYIAEGTRRLYYLNWIYNNQVKPEDELYINGAENIILKDGNANDYLIALNLDCQE